MRQRPSYTVDETEEKNAFIYFISILYRDIFERYNFRV